ncbi:MAG: aminomethyl-transferring glycine dehydrogenase [Gammaproteobacteria bacterium]|nr:aminomethyl-transferring glycine dehydrogenase [Gammaproteobacteria bacterium]
MARSEAAPDERQSLAELEMRGDFIRRHIGPDRHQIADMVRHLGLDSLEQLPDRAIPDSVRSQTPLAMIDTISERAVITHLRQMRERNKVFISMLGMGYHGTIMPQVVKRNVLENPGWYTAYTPYQAEISQGRLEALLNYQQMIIDLTGMEIANASLLDEATAAAEAMAMSRRVSKSAPDVYFVDQDCHPQTIAVVRTRARYLGFTIRIGCPFTELDRQEIFGVLVQWPGSSGEVRDLRAVVERAHARAAVVTVATDILGLVLLTPPGELGADVVVGSSQRFGVPMGYGGPHAAFFATRRRFARQMPGRLIGNSVDNEGGTALRMALQTREQHIRREKATSNICTSQVLPAVLASFYAIYHGPKGLRLIAGRVHRLTQILTAGFRRSGIEVASEVFFDTIKVRVPSRARRIAAKAREARMNLRVFDADHLGITFDETIRRKDLLALWKVFAAEPGAALDIDELDRGVVDCLPADLRRRSAFLAHPVFEMYHCETEMMRYMRWLARRDIALDRAMIPLGSCTMKLNSSTALQALSYREFSAMHPFAPLDQAQGYLQMFEELEQMLCDLTGFAAFSLQPNAGSQGEYAGLLVIRKYQEIQGQGGRNVCLIPASAHGTNPASAVMAGLEVVVVACDADGNVDVEDLRAKAAQHAPNLAALMVTYPSTHGVYEEAIRDICAVVHEHGGQVYLDGANMNALVGICRPAEIGADVMHINLHKTFAIPHGGGGPGMGPIGVREHLAPYLPDHPCVEGVNPAAGPAGTIGTVSAAPWGSASILAISWAYIAMMGAHGLRRATLVAILNANYVAQRLKPYYPILYSGKNGFVAHECIIDLRAIREVTGISVDDVAKRLVDYGFHAPTMSFPVADSFMIEPTESENKRELDRFCDAMIAIRAEIEAIEKGRVHREHNLLKNAPHTHRLLLSGSWDRPYSRREAFFPMESIRDDKYWPPVGRIDNAYGDRNLSCSCLPVGEYAKEQVAGG